MSAQKVTRFHAHSNTLTHTHTLTHNLWLKCVFAFSFRWLFHCDFPLSQHFAHLHFYEHFAAYPKPPLPRRSPRSRFALTAVMHVLYMRIH